MYACNLLYVKFGMYMWERNNYYPRIKLLAEFHIRNRINGKFLIQIEGKLSYGSELAGSDANGSLNQECF